MKHNISIILFAATCLGGCAFQPMPQNAEDFRKLINSGSMGSAFESYEVKRPYREVTKNIKAKTNECLSAKVDRRSCTHTTSTSTCNDSTDTYVPTLINGVSKTEVHVQFMRAGQRVGMLQPGDQTQPPEKGMYVIVADYFPIENGKATKVDIYRARVFNVVPDALKHWAENTDQGCPSLVRP